jgi:hypothetical protein
MKSQSQALSIFAVDGGVGFRICSSWIRSDSDPGDFLLLQVFKGGTEDTSVTLTPHSLDASTTSTKLTGLSPGVEYEINLRTRAGNLLSADGKKKIRASKLRFSTNLL